MENYPNFTPQRTSDAFFFKAALTTNIHRGRPSVAETWWFVFVSLNLHPTPFCSTLVFFTSLITFSGVHYSRSRREKESLDFLALRRDFLLTRADLSRILGTGPVLTAPRHLEPPFHLELADPRSTSVVAPLVARALAPAHTTARALAPATLPHVLTSGPTPAASSELVDASRVIPVTAAEISSRAVRFSHTDNDGPRPLPLWLDLVRKDGMNAKSAKDDMATVVLDSPQPASIYRFIAKIESISHIDTVAHLVPRASTTLSQLQKVLRRNFAPNTDESDLVTKVEQFQWDTSRMGPLEALNKLTYLNTSLPFANRLSDDRLKTILISGCQDDRWKSLVKKESYSGKKWDDLTITVDDIVDHMQLHHPRVIAKSDSSETAAIMHAFNEKFENLTQVVADSQREVVRLRRELKKAPNTRDNLLVHIAENTELPLPFVNMSDELVNRTLNTYIHTLNSVLTSDGDSELSDVDIISLRADIEMIRNGAREPYQRQPYRQGYPPRNNDFNNRSRQGSYNNSD
ncbi:hypothetical protein BC829DRAFT_466875 [Chytridium lagenaria]|nr:hypothetical protein BC829DRAFT_466875 [Chytridium lagenaria]